MKKRIYAHLMDPKENPDYVRRSVKPPDWEVFGKCINFVALRSFSVREEKIYGYKEILDSYTVHNKLANVIWPSYSILFADNLEELVEEIKKRNLFLFDIWGYVPGSGAGGYWTQFHPKKRNLALLEDRLGEKWLGMDVGEQDGRYVLAYVSQMVYPSADRVRQYLNFQKHIQRICEELGNRMVALLAITLAHNELKDGGYTMIGAETAQMHPNAQVFYGFLRGAGKQYGVPWFGNASVYNRWGYKNYVDGGTATEEAGNHGPRKGTSLSLLKRLLYSHILYNCMIVGFESGWFQGKVIRDENGKERFKESGILSPIGMVQEGAYDFVQKYGQPGAMVTQYALMGDFFFGWNFPNYNQLYRVWGNRPYEACDYFMDNVWDMFYPGYQNSSFFHNEAGFITPAPYGDSVDCLLSDAESWLLMRYPVIVVTGQLSGEDEIREKLEDYVRTGGSLVITAGNIRKFHDGFAGIRVEAKTEYFIEGTTVNYEDGEITETSAFELLPFQDVTEYKVMAYVNGTASAIEIKYGEGRITALASPFGIGLFPTGNLPIEHKEDTPIPRPYPMLLHVKAVLDKVFCSQRLFSCGADISVIVCRRERGKYTLGICNSNLSEKTFHIESNVGKLVSVMELEIDQREKLCEGYLPEGFEDCNIGKSGAERIAGGAIRIFHVEIMEEESEEINHMAPAPRPDKVALFIGEKDL